ncbi:MAG: lasso peptide biosynthesis protein [Theionarchaea archaeon]|nr:lasso peptide biosynthesis protein [Theionarchaea archaeon]MBU7039121.1 lasso peptide biosynthesis protein [Theionarchaea archaeon]
MNKKPVLLACGLAAVMIVFMGTTYQYSVLQQEELDKSVSITEETQRVRGEITSAESGLQQTEQKIAETEDLIPVEQQEQAGLRQQIDELDSQESVLESEIDLQKRILTKDPRVLITTDDPVVIAKVEEVTRLCRTTEEKQQAIFEYVRKEIEYVTEGNPKEWKYPKEFLAFKFDFWQLPRETIEWRKGDCEDRSILLCTMMRIAGVPASNVKVVLGVIHYSGGMSGHAWIEFEMGGTWYALESTCPTCNYIEKDLYYSYFNPDLWGWFNDKEYHDLKSADSNSGALIGSETSYF